MPFLIADSGSTKTEWRLVSPAGRVSPASIFTEGLNPYYHTPQSLSDVISGNLLPEFDDSKVEQIFFYGAGCDGSKRNKMVEVALRSNFADADIEVEHDLLAAARACFGERSGIACILGTGSNSCLYNGNKITDHIPSLAFILGDEGSAGYFGKKLINSYFRFELPDDLKKELEEFNNMELNHIMTNISDGKQTSRFVASYAKFLGDHTSHPFVDAMLREGFQSFINRIVKNYTNVAAYPVSFVGSVALGHQKLIEEILEQEGLTPGKFIQNPMEHLVNYHQS
jgi:N-acetylglucosamine kinase-like BadF-type ATPase